MLAIVLVSTGVLTIFHGSMRGTAATAGPNWWKVDLHEHSAFSGDARADIVLDEALAKKQNYNAVFVTDHDRGSGFQIAGANGNFLSFTDALSSRWTPKAIGTGAIAPAAVTTQHYDGAASLHVSASTTSGSSVRSVAYNVRGVGLRSGDVMLDFWVLPQTLSGTAGIDVSVSLGGDPNIGRSVFGYTTSDNQSHPGKSTVLVWQLGNAYATGPGTYANSLPFNAAEWNHYVIDVSTGAVTWNGNPQPSTTGIHDLPAADAPADYDVLSDVKMEASASNGTADGYFDDYTLSVKSPQCPASEFAYRASLFSSLGLSSGTNATGQPFAMFPAREMGQNYHANQFNFEITSAGQYSDTYTDSTQDDNALCSSTNSSNPLWSFKPLGKDNIAAVQASGYPAQLNHPGVTDPSPDRPQDIVTNNAYGADAVEARTGEDYTAVWDQILQKNVILMGTQGSDAHEGPAKSTPAMYIDAPALTLKDLMHSYFEGRMYGAPGDFPGRVVFNLDGSSSPYPARYPIWVPSTQASANVNLSVTGGITGNRVLRWVYYNAGGTLHTSDTAAGIGSYASGAHSVPLSGAYTYIRAEVFDTTPGVLAPTVANTEPIFFESVTGMPAGMSARVDSITPPTGTCDCTMTMTKGLTSVAYSGSTLSLGLTNPADSGVQMIVQSPQAPTSVKVDNVAITPAADSGAYQGGSGTSWFYDASAKVLYIRDLQAAGTSSVSATFPGGSTDQTPPSVPQSVSASPVGSSEVDLSWGASSDAGSGVAGYRLYRNGSLVNQSALITSTSFKDTGLSASTSYSYTVSAVDGAGNESGQSSPAVSVSTGAGGGGGGGSLTFAASADSYVDGGSPSAINGASKQLRVDTTPVVNSYVRFAVSGVSGSVTSVQLKVKANSNLAAGFEVDALSDDSWSESTLTVGNAPTPGGKLTTSGPVTAGSTVTIDLPPSSVSGNGDVNFVFSGLSGTALSLASRESGSGPQLVVTSSGSGGGGDSTAPSVPQNVKATPVGSSEIDLSWDASTDAGGVAGYNVYRGGALLNKLGPIAATSFKDTGLMPSTPYSYTVSAVDNSGNESAQSTAAQATTGATGGGGGGGATSTFTAVADAYVDGSNTMTSYGSRSTLRVDTTPDVRSYLRFNVGGLSGPVAAVTLKVFANSNLPAGFSVAAVADDTWTEGVTYATAPNVGAQWATSGPATTGSFVSISLPPGAVTGNGDVNFALVGISSTALSLASRESGNPPQLVVTTS